jgi:hypothetical protein
MLATALLVAAGALIAGGSVLGLRADLRRRLDRSGSAPDGADRERAEALRQISREIDRGRQAGKGFY